MEITLAPLVPGTPNRGPLPESEVRALLAAGQLAPGTLAWTPGRVEWAAVGALLGVAPPPAPLGNLPPPLTVPEGERRTSPLAIASILCGFGVLLLGFFSGIPAIITGHLAQKRIRESHGRLKGSGLALTGLICGYVSLVLVPIMLLAAIAVPGFLRARKRSQATSILNDARVIDGAINQFAIEKDKRAGESVNWEDLLPYLKPGSRLANSGGRDMVGRPYIFGRITDEPAQVKVHADTVRDFQDVVSDSRFWGDYLPEAADLNPPPVRRPAAARPRGTSAILRELSQRTASWNCGWARSVA